MKNKTPTDYLPLKEGSTPIEFLTTWGRAFRDCFEYASQRRHTTAPKHQRLMFICGDAVWALKGEKPRLLTQTAEGAIEGLEELEKEFQEFAKLPNANLRQVGRRLDMIETAISEIRERNAAPAAVQMELF